MAKVSKEFNQFLDQYDDLAVHVVGDTRPNISHGIEYSNSEISQVVMETLDWEDFDLFQDMDFAAAYATDDADTVRAYCFLAFLRLDLFCSAVANDVGDLPFNKLAAASSEYWYKRLMEKSNALFTGAPAPTHKWIN